MHVWWVSFCVYIHFGYVARSNVIVRSVSFRVFLREYLRWYPRSFYFIPTRFFRYFLPSGIYTGKTAATNI
ncbi:hypothetical protein PUN28_013102 [Cardiocondyla obscurior]|uniref:Secreted protein n=1 Tax=Cardiocondyla obscurior TaxID=286306 RepID=A0AAW2FAZ8_9HYME